MKSRWSTADFVLETSFADEQLIASRCELFPQPGGFEILRVSYGERLDSDVENGAGVRKRR